MEGGKKLVLLRGLVLAEAVVVVVGREGNYE